MQAGDLLNLALIFGSVLAISSIAAIGFVTFRWDNEKLERYLPIGIAVAVGVLLGEAAFHLIPESAHLLGMQVACLYALIGIGASLLLEIACRLFERGEVAPVARIAVLAESMHNAIDGAIVAAAYLGGIRLGLIATFAVAVHELPHELGNFAVLVEAGYSRSRALLLNLISAGAAFFGALSVVLAGHFLLKSSPFILAGAAGSFVYISVIGLLPILWRRARNGLKAPIGFGITAGVGVMLILTFSH